MKKNHFLVLCIVISFIAIIVGCFYNSSTSEHRPASWIPTSWTAKRAISYFSYFRPALTYDKKAVEESLQVGVPYYSVHNNMVYHGDDITKTYVEGSDIDSFFPIIGDYGLDNYALYIAGIRYPVNTGSLIIYGYSSYIASSGIVYNINGEGEMKPLGGVDPEKFMPLSYVLSGGAISYNGIYAKDDKYIYVQDQILSGADYDTFELIDAGTAKDKNHSYKNGKITE